MSYFAHEHLQKFNFKEFEVIAILSLIAGLLDVLVYKYFSPSVTFIISSQKNSLP